MAGQSWRKWLVSNTKKPSLGRVAVSAFHDDRDSVLPDMERDPRSVPPFRVE